jgi:hypothetical protein
LRKSAANTNVKKTVKQFCQADIKVSKKPKNDNYEILNPLSISADQGWVKKVFKKG